MNLLWRFGVVGIAAVDDIISSSAPLTGVLGAFLSLLPGSGRNRLGEGCCEANVSLVKVKLLQESSCLFVCWQLSVCGSLQRLTVDSLSLQEVCWNSLFVFFSCRMTEAQFINYDNEVSALLFGCLLFSCCGGNITMNLQQIGCRPICNVLKDEW